MKKQIPTCLSYLLSVALWLIAASPVVAQSAMFVYQGRLTQAGNAVTGIYDLQFKLFDTANVGTGAQQGGTLSNSVAVTNGVFTVALDFGAAVFDGSPRFLEIGVRSGSASPYNTLAPRQQVTSIPYAIHSLDAATAATALNVASGSVVKSLNTLKDDVTLAAGPNVTITPSGNTLTIASTGAGGSSLWSLNGADAYYSAGNVGIGTATLTNGVRLEVNGGALFTPGGSGGTIQLGTPSAETGMTIKGINRADVRFDGDTLKLAAGSGTAPPPAQFGMTINTSGNVGIGMPSPLPTSQWKFDVNGPTRITGGGSGGAVQFSAPNGESGMGIVGANRADLRFNGSTLKLVAGLGSGAPPAENGIAITTSGSVGIGTTAPFAKLHVETPENSRAAIYGTETGTASVGVYGNATDASSVGVWGRNPNGNAVYADGNAAQARDKGGFVKAMIYVNGDNSILRCYNGVKADASTVKDCGFSVKRFVSSGHNRYRIDFGFQVNDRFLSVTPRAGSNLGATFDFASTPNQVDVDIFLTDVDYNASYASADFMIIVY